MGKSKVRKKAARARQVRAATARRRDDRHAMTTVELHDRMAGSATRRRATSDTPFGTWEEAHDYLAELAVERGAYAGIPMPVDGFAFTLEPHYSGDVHTLEMILDQADEDPVHRLVAARQAARGFTHTCTTADMFHVRNSWWSRARNAEVILYEVEGEPGVKMMLDKRARAAGRRSTFLLATLGASQGWDVRAEERAQTKLRALLSEPMWRMYALTGSFLESSDRSRVMYVLRRGRPTIAMVPWDRCDPDAEELPMRVLGALCMHPIGYYRNTYAGAMVPTDDVIAHLMMIRGDEHLLWRRANLHPPDAPEAGI